MAQEVTIKRIEFNVDLPDELFAFEFPPEARVYDGLTGRGWIGAPAEEQHLKVAYPASAVPKLPVESAGWRGRLWLWSAVCLVSVAALAGLIIWGRRRRAG